MNYEETMNYEEASNYMQNIYNQKQGNPLYSFLFYPLPGYKDLIIEYPGYKENGDYRVRHNNQHIKHTEIVEYLYNITKLNGYRVILNFIHDVFDNGLKANHSISINLTNQYINSKRITTKQLKFILFWVTLQEDINYPNGRGRKLPFARYVESILAATPFADNISLYDIINRTNNHGKKIPSPLFIGNSPKEFQILLQKLY